MILVGFDALMSHVNWKSTLPMLELPADSQHHSMAHNPAVHIDDELEVFAHTV